MAPWLLSMLAVGCAPRAVAVPKLPPVSRAHRQTTAVRCAGTPEELDCVAVTAIDTEERERFATDDRWVSSAEDWELTAEAPVARHRALARAWGLRSCRFEDDGCLHRLRVPLVPIRQRGARFSSWVRIEDVEGFVVDRTAAREHVDVGLRSVPRLTSPGGPVGMVGWRLGGESVVGRVGWEAFAPTFLGHGVTLEGETDGELRFAYVPQVTTPSVLGFPSLGIGLGMPVRLVPRLATGVRVQGTLAFPYVGVIAWLDLIDDVEAPVRGYLGAQVSL